MVDDKYIGLALAMSSSLAIGSSYIITKKGLIDAAKRNAHGVRPSENLSYLRNGTWWAGISTLVLGELANFAAYIYAPAILVTPLGALSVLIGAILASILLKEELGKFGRVGCALALIGSIIIVLHAPEDPKVDKIDQILALAVQPGFLLYLLVSLVFCLVMIYRVSKTHGRTYPWVYISICSVSGSVSVMAIKGFGTAVRLTFDGENQFGNASTWVFGIVVVGCIVVQMNYLNKALDLFSTNVVNPIYYVLFSSATIVASLILHHGFNTTGGTNTVSLISGFVVTFLGVYLLNISRQPDNPALPLHSPENMRMSLSGFHPAENNPQSTRTFNNNTYHAPSNQELPAGLGVEELGADGQAIPLHRLDDDDDELDGEDFDMHERSRLHPNGGPDTRHDNGDAIGSRTGSRNGSRLNLVDEVQSRASDARRPRS